jgi:dTDP-glucose pyrophosphorylase
MWGIVPAAGRGSRIQPLAFSKELLPVGSRADGDRDRPMAVSEHLVERMLRAGCDKLCFVIAPGKSDILEYYGGRVGAADVCYLVQGEPRGLCDALFRALPFVRDDEWITAGLPDTIWFPSDALCRLTDDPLSFLLFPVEHPEFFDAVELDAASNVVGIQVKTPRARSRWIWGAFKMSGRTFRALHDLWQERAQRDEYWGTLVQAYLERGGRARAVRAGEAYVDVGTLNGYRAANQLLELRSRTLEVFTTEESAPISPAVSPLDDEAARGRRQR